MGSKTSETNILYMKPVYRIAYSLCLIPPYNAYENRKFGIYRCYALFIFAFIVVGFNTIFYEKILGTYPFQPITVAVIDALYNFVFMMSLVVASIRSIFLVKKFKKFVDGFIIVDKCLGDEEITRSISYKFYGELFLAHIYIIFLFIYDGYVWIHSVGYEIFCKYFLKDIPQYANMIMVIIMFNFAKSLKIRFEQINEWLEKVDVAINSEQGTQPSVPEVKVNNFVAVEKQGPGKDVNQIRRLYKELSALVTLYNSMFGWPVFFLCAITLMGLLEVVNMGLVITVVEGGNFIGNVDLEIDFIVLGFLWTTTLLVMGVVVAVTCDMTTKEAQRTATVCYNLLLDVPAVSNNVQDRILREELILLAQQATHQCPYFSAAGFFNVDYTMLFGLLGTVTSYIIVLIQINK